jgi:hypothetical protein
MQMVSNDAARVLGEKLALSREVATLKPEVESLRNQAASNRDLLSEKLSLQREVTTLQVELENAKRSAERATARAGKFNPDESAHEAQIEDLRKQLREAKSAHRESRRELEEVKDELSAVKTTAEKPQRSSLKQVQIDDNAEERLREKIEQLRNDLASERKENSKLEKALAQEKQTFEAQKSLLDEKLSQFRTKLRSTKERLREAEEQLENAEEAAEAKPRASTSAPKPAKNLKKRGASQMDPEAIGTPGDGPPAKRGKRGSSLIPTAPGEKSNFSITPFLNRTVTLPTDTPEEAVQEPEKRSLPSPEPDLLDSPSDDPSRKAIAKRAPKAKALGPAGAGKHNPKVSRKKPARPTLENVAEESSELIAQFEAEPPSKPEEPVNEPSEPEEKPAKEPTAKIALNNVPKLKPAMMKPRKSLATFSSFIDEPAPEKRKKRKLGGAAIPKTLFDEEEDQPPSKPIPGRGGLFAGRVFGKTGVSKGPLTNGGDGFMFSPLKKDRRAMSSGKSMLNVAD